MQESHDAYLAVDEPAVFDVLDQKVEYLIWGLLHLVEEHDTVRPPPDRLGQLTAFLIPDVSRRGTNEPGHRVPFGVLAHVDPDHGPLVVEQELRECFS